MNKLSKEEQVRVVACLVEGNSLRATVRMTGIHRTTIQKLLAELGCACSEFQDQTLRNLECPQIQCDEIWSFVNSKEKNTSAEKKAKGCGDSWTWTALCADSKLIIGWHVGGHALLDAHYFTQDIASRIKGSVQISTDGFTHYSRTIPKAFGEDVAYGQEYKIYDRNVKPGYSPATVIGCTRKAICGKPDLSRTSTAFIERSNLTIRMGNRRFTRLTNGFSKKAENHEAAIALHFMYYNFARIHQTLRCTPAIRAGISDHVWSLEEIVGLLV